MTYMLARQRKEGIICIQMVYLTWRTYLESHKEKHAEVCLLLDEAYEKYEQGVDRHEAFKHRARSLRMVQATLVDWVKNQKQEIDKEKIAITMYVFLDVLIKNGLIENPEGNPIDRIMDFMLCTIDPDSDITQKRLVNAEKLAWQWVDKFQDQGYFVPRRKIC